MKEIITRTPIWARWVLLLLLSLVFILGYIHRAKLKEEKERALMAAYTNNHFAHAKQFVDQNQIDSAIARINLINKQYRDTTAIKADSLFQMIQHSKSEQVAFDWLITMTDAEVNQLKLGKYKKQFLPNSRLNQNFTTLLIKNIGKRREYFKKAEAEAKALKAERKREKILALKEKKRLASITALNERKRRSKTNSYVSSENTSSSSGYTRGPRGGCYYINSNGNKTYVDRSLCN